MDAILAEATIYQRRLALDRMTKGPGLQDAYDKTLNRIRQQGGSKSRLGMEALMWISHCERPLRSQELWHALGVQLGAEDFSIQNVLSIRTVLGYTLGLVTLDEKASRPHLLHLTLQEYLGQHPTLFATAHSMMAEICLTYLNCLSIRALPPNLDNVLDAKPFLEYATCFRGDHAARGVTEPVKSLALRLFDGYESHVSAGVLWGKRIRGRGRVEDTRRISGLHCIAFWGIEEIAIAMLEMKRWQVNWRDFRSRTPLMWAVLYKKRGMVELFLEQEDIEPDTVMEDGRTVFSFAAELGNEDAVKLLLKRGDVNPNSMDRNGRTPISLAAGMGREGVVKLLLERGDVDPNSCDYSRRTPLSFTAHQFMTGAPAAGHEGVAKLLLERADVDPNSPGINSRTLLSLAAEWGQERLVKLLLERGDLDPNSPDSNGRTPLSFAAERGKEGLVKLLLERRDVDPNSPDDNGRTLISFAAEKGWEGIVMLLLERGDVDPNSPDGNGRTLISFAVERGQGGVIKLLLERGDVDPNLPDGNGRTPLSSVFPTGQAAGRPAYRP